MILLYQLRITQKSLYISGENKERKKIKKMKAFFIYDGEKSQNEREKKLGIKFF